MTLFAPDEVLPGVVTEAPPAALSNGGPQVLQPPAAPEAVAPAPEDPEAVEETAAPPRRTPAVRKVKIKGKAKATKKAPAKKKPATTAGRPAILKPTARLTVLAKKNPWRAGTKAQAEFAKFKTGATVAATLKRGVRPRFLLWSRKLKHVKISA